MKILITFLALTFVLTSCTWWTEVKDDNTETLNESINSEIKILDQDAEKTTNELIDASVEAQETINSATEIIEDPEAYIENKLKESLNDEIKNEIEAEINNAKEEVKNSFEEARDELDKELEETLKMLEDL